MGPCRDSSFGTVFWGQFREYFRTLGIHMDNLGTQEDCFGNFRDNLETPGDSRGQSSDA